MNTVPFSFGPSPSYKEGSGLRSKRDSENPALAWKKGKAVALNVDEVMRTLVAVQNELANLRRRRVGGAPTGQTVYVKACLEDGTECYVPIQVSDTIYRTRADVPGTAPTINEGKVPDGTTELI